jgi:hypothetical protein
MSNTFGFATSQWHAGRAWVRRRLRKVAREQSTITYGELAEEIVRDGPMDEFSPFGAPMAAILAQANYEEQEAGHFPLLSVLVILKDGGLPGNGFFQFARELGMSVGPSADAKLEFWASQIKACHEYWSGRSPSA